MPKNVTNHPVNSSCLCGSGLLYSDCCEPFHTAKRFPETAEQLMRSRYVAYSLQLKQYLLETWAKSSRPAEIEFESGLSWHGLQIIKVSKGRKKDKQGQVTFTARYQVGFEKGSFTETSTFVRDPQARWTYFEGKFT